MKTAKILNIFLLCSTLAIGAALFIFKHEQHKSRPGALPDTGFFSYKKPVKTNLSQFEIFEVLPNGDALATAMDETGLIRIDKVYIRDKPYDNQTFSKGQVIIESLMYQLGYFVSFMDNQFDTIPVIGDNKPYYLDMNRLEMLDSQDSQSSKTDD